MIDWYHLSGKDARNVILLVVSTQRPVVLTAGKMVNLSLMSFSSVSSLNVKYNDFSVNDMILTCRS